MTMDQGAVGPPRPRLGKLNEAGMDGMIFGLIDYIEELKYFGHNVMPLLKEAGLRH